jgi:anti-anti-sigma regulatory factor
MTDTRVANHQCQITLQTRPGGAVITVSGIFDWVAVRELLTDVGDAEGEPRLLIDLASVERIDSAGTAGLIAALLREHPANAQVGIVAHDRVAEVLDAVGVSQVVSVFVTRRAGEAWLASSQSA